MTDLDTAAPPTVTWADEKHTAATMDCPNCGSAGAKPALLTVHFATPDWPLRHWRVLRCPGCGCAFYEHQEPPDYTESQMLGRGRLAFYLQQGAGLSLITRPLARVRKPAASKYLDVGCGFGFGLDFALRAREWTGTGIDPGGVADSGQTMLGIPIQRRYLSDEETEFPHDRDVVFSSETIEHVRSPSAFVRTLRETLKPGGVLVLTTPDGEALQPAASPGMLTGLLSPGLHLIFQTAASLTAILRAAGFCEVRVERDSYALIAYASDEAIVLEDDPQIVRQLYLDYLEGRIAGFGAGDDLFYGFAGRLILEAVNDGEMERADRAYGMLRQACTQRFGFDIDAVRCLPSEAATCSLERLAQIMPLNLGCVLYADTIRRLLRRTPRRGLEARFLTAAGACDALRRTLGELSMDDGLSEDVGWTCRAEALLCAASAGAKDIVARATELPRPPGDNPSRRRAFLLRAVIEAAQGGHDRMARELAGGIGIQDAEWSHATLPAPMRRTLQAVARRLGIQMARPAAPDDLEARLVALVGAGDYDAAVPFAEALNQGRYGLAPRNPNSSESNTLFCLAVLDARPGGNPARARQRFAAVRAACEARAPAQLPALFWSALNGEHDMVRRFDGEHEAARQRAAILRRLGREDPCRG